LALSWLLWLPLAGVRVGLLPAWVAEGRLTGLALPGVLVPSLVAVALCAHLGDGALRALAASLVAWRVGASWWVAVLLQPVLLVVTALLALSGDPPVQDPSPGSAGALVVTAAALVVASFGEETGWRGVALPALVRRHGWIRGNLVLGLFVATWHLPYWVLQGVFEDHGAVYLLLDFVFVVALTYQLAWLVRRSRGSVLVAVVFHVSFNLVNVALLPVTATTGAFAILTVLEVAVAVVAIRSLSSARVL
jgi:membrane protease YdiL (CAAX protease family)